MMSYRVGSCIFAVYLLKESVTLVGRGLSES